jgi:uncharacterized protein YfdQ (DUF2303 family)
MSDNSNEPANDTEAAIIAGRDSVDLETRITKLDLEHGSVHVGIDADGEIHVLADVHKFDDARRPAPLRRAGTAVLEELGSFTEYVNRYKTVDTVAWADAGSFGVTAVFNEHPEGQDLGDAGFRDNRAIYNCPRSHEWLEWTSKDGKAMGQAAFGDWIEHHLDDLAAPNAELPDFPQPTTLLEMARKLSINIGGTFKREINPTTGEGTLISKQEHGADSTKIPRAFLLKVPVFMNGTAYYVEARLRFALGEGGPSFTYLLHNRVAIERDAFGEVRAQVAKQCAIPVLAGKVG